MRVLIVGCGYVGLPLGAELARQGNEVFGLTLSGGADEATRARNIHPLTADIARRADLDALPGPFEWIVNCVSSNKGDAEAYRRVYLEGTRNLLDWLAPCPPRKFVCVGSTSVYGQTDGSVVKESSPTDPDGELADVLLATERLLLDAARVKKIPCVLLRSAGIYGPGRGHLFLQYLRDEARIAGRGEQIVNMIHRDDLVAAIIAALKSGRPGDIYNVCDDEPVPQIHFFRWLSETLGKNMPPFAPVDGNAPRKRPVTNKRVSNRRLRMEMGCQLRYPTFRQGYTAEIQRLQDAGEL